MGEWQGIRLGDFAPFKYGKALPERNRRPGDVPVYGSNGVVGSHDTPLIDRSMVVIGRKGSIGEVHFSPQGGWPIDTTFYVTSGQGRDIRFTYYLLRTLGMQYMSSDSAVPGLNREAAHNLVVQIPPLSEQRAIAEVLGALDDKIEANRKNELHAHELIGALFKRLMMQQSHTEVRLIEAVQFVYGEPFNSSYFNSERLGRPLIRIRDLKTFAPQTYTTEERDRETIVAPGSVVVGMDAEFRPTIWCGEPGLLNQRVSLALPLVGSPSFTYMLLREPLAHVESFKTGTTVSHLNKTDLEQIRVTIPESAALCQFDSMAEPLREMIVASHQENRALADLRDALLPELMSGELRVREAERLVEDAV